MSQQNVEATNEVIAEEEQHYSVEYLKLEELTNVENALDTEMLNQILEDHEPITKKIKTDDETNVVKTVLNQEVPLKRKTPSSNVQNIAENTRKSPRNVGTSTKNQVEVAQKNGHVESDIASTSKASKTVNQRKKPMGKGSLQTAVKTATPDKLKLIAGSETGDSGDKVSNVKVNEKRMRVQKIVVTKAEAAAMAKQGRLCIKDGNLILTQKPSK